jgi:peptidoglycan/LPS O-acetylase OafA/YrhL
MQNHSQLDYRPDIDGLRALAVSSVVLFHAFPQYIQGGFVGVDVFFVISGFLITQLILRELQNNTFSIQGFYARRVRRIFPALGLVLGFGLLVGWICLNFIEYKQLAKHEAISAIFLINFQFLKEAGYFDNAADTKPMLHLWSLAIEEQFYMCWPLLLLLFKRIPKWSMALLAMLFIFSLGYSLYLVWHHDLVRDFYSPLSRFWELLLGGALAFYLLEQPRAVWNFRPLISWLSLALILGSVLLLTEKMSFPGYWALLPTLGTAGLILSGMSCPLNRVLLASRLFVAVGLISYPLYLWHWPLLSFARIINSQTPSNELKSLLILVSVVLAWLTFRFIEKPIRYGKRFPHAVLWLALWMIAVLLMGHAINRLDGLKFRHYGKLNADTSSLVLGADRDKLLHTCTVPVQEQALFEWCYSDGKAALPQYAVLGDSKGEALYFSLVQAAKPHQSWTMLGDVVTVADDEPQVNKAAFKALDNNPELKVIVLTNALRGLFPLDSVTGFIKQTVPEEEIDRKVHVYSKWIAHWQLTGKLVVYVIDNPTLPDPNSCISGGLTPFDTLNTVLRRVENPLCKIRYTEHLKGTSAYQQFIIKLKEQNPSLLVYDPLPALCDIPSDQCTISKNGKFLYSYGDHVSDHGGGLMANELLPLIDAAQP